MKNSLLLAFTSILISILLTNPAYSSNGLSLKNEQEEVIKFSDVEKPPFYIDWCTSNISKDKIRECTDSGIKLFAKTNFNTEIAADLNLSGYQRITSAFIIDKSGKIDNIRVRASHPDLEKEALRVINLIPKMEPGIQNGEAVSTSYLLPIIFKVQSDSLSQSEKNPILNIVDGDNVEVPFSTVQNVPIFPGCDKGNNEARRKCMSKKITKFVKKEFNTDLAGDLGLKGRQRISVIFKIDKNGDVVGVRARAPHPKLKAEAIRVVNMLPKMKPGTQLGKAVVVPYSLPIIFEVAQKVVYRIERKTPGNSW
ncbi:energy transducer TonB [Flavobacteriaceae bacterium]|nr:energy transducer TonB [Flavobacteriaceae bacterium]